MGRVGRVGAVGRVVAGASVGRVGAVGVVGATVAPGARQDTVHTAPVFPLLFLCDLNMTLREPFFQSETAGASLQNLDDQECQLRERNHKPFLSSGTGGHEVTLLFAGFIGRGESEGRAGEVQLTLLFPGPLDKIWLERFTDKQMITLKVATQLAFFP